MISPLAAEKPAKKRKRQIETKSKPQARFRYDSPIAARAGGQFPFAMKLDQAKLTARLSSHNQL
jgi:hypothetical protein